MNAKVVNFSKIGHDIDVDTKTVQNYFEILSDTHLGVLLQSHDNSLRKRQRKNPKFYYFDTGVARSLNRRLNVPLKTGTFEYGDLFEQFVIIERPGLPMAFVEIKSTSSVRDEDLGSLKSLRRDLPKAHFFCISNDDKERTQEGVQILSWRKGLQELGFKPSANL